MNKVYVLGIGPGNKDYLLKKTEKIIGKMDVLIGGSRALETLAENKAEKIKITLPLVKIKNYILANYEKKKIAVLVSGDPGLYSLLNYLKREINIDILEVIPGISSLQLAASRIQISWNDMRITSLHGKDNKDELLVLLKKEAKVGFFTDNKFPPAKIAEYLLKNKIKDKTICVFENLSYADENITVGSAEEIKKLSFSKLTVMIILDNNQLNSSLRGDIDE
ncbi:precorrin-6y C5,15-methyltransferase (decarboxylating) subunit CbiE [Halanaerobium congolense]|uniref:Precorrin-6Y C5,15-methyltransferase (Decarboxylating) n=1 Tax=Halanaerobium congolense TaxID=54121 RepID=A0A1G9S3M8_9FIRM|nr:precorrin-6y C5,15-methyltransferase (decarboxylating) subunit CbiE [Halanaerobium congolense]PXV64820.1 precorrin-6Y C5,15-methyltransferase (decarboxylating) [Halanaerobium congolense]TDS35396.1 precorrin-6Y C5,15-methyltransferase (decarboxylating) [Halanaerobium congolense]SDK64315.1 precorrin-6Y C5,15-methyltransferase (decarboxylating) [Halanaerobium congolense]SDM29880.1 precorrin-6Y C5,15-methyltransferase (decarboxylating) [Halanaerobium congolense]